MGLVGRGETILSFQGTKSMVRIPSSRLGDWGNRER